MEGPAQTSVESEGDVPSTEEAAGLGRRAAALVTDAIILVPLLVLFSVLFGEAEADDDGFAVLVTGVPGIVFILLAFSYFFLLEARDGQTLGKRLLGIRVVADDGGELSGTAVFLRALLRLIDGIFFYLVGFLTALVTEKNQRLGDLAGSTRVVKA